MAEEAVLDSDEDVYPVYENDDKIGHSEE